MALGKKTGGKDFKQGQSGNPNGRPKLPEDVKSCLKLNQVEFVRLANEFLSMPVKKLKEIAENPEETVLRQILAVVLLEAIKNGDCKRLEFFLNRLITKPRQHIEADVTQKSLHLEIVKLINNIEKENQIVSISS